MLTRPGDELCNAPKRKESTTEYAVWGGRSFAKDVSKICIFVSWILFFSLTSRECIISQWWRRCDGSNEFFFFQKSYIPLPLLLWCTIQSDPTGWKSIMESEISLINGIDVTVKITTGLDDCNCEERLRTRTLGVPTTCILRALKIRKRNKRVARQLFEYLRIRN